MNIFKKLNFFDEAPRNPLPNRIEITITPGSGDFHIIQYISRVNGVFTISRELTPPEEIPIKAGTGLLTVEISENTGAAFVSFANNRGDILHKSELITPKVRAPRIHLSMPSGNPQVGVEYRILYRLENKDLLRQASINVTSPLGDNLLSRELDGNDLSSGCLDLFFIEVGLARVSCVVLPNDDDLEPQLLNKDLEIEPNAGLSLDLWWDNPAKRTLAWKSKGYRDLYLLIGNSKAPLPAEEGVIGSFPFLLDAVAIVGTTQWGQSDTVNLE
ncbi:MAG: hypothetical protein LBF38_06615 [Deltaproteobacteria bacterium]|jgi:hypothetical protein|nr:hypothetical protein [Deltaproteobacteria bacterium]